MMTIPPELPSNLPLVGAQAYVAYKLLGPSAEAMGSRLANLTEFAADNLARVVRNAHDKLGQDLEEPGAVSPRALSKIVDEASFSDNEVVVDYLGGILASGRDTEGRDDRAVSWSALVGRLSSQQLRLHYLLYAGLREEIVGEDLNLGTDEDRKKCRSYVTFLDLLPALGEDERTASLAEFEEAFYGLQRESLVEDPFSFGPVETVRRQAPGVDEPGLVWGPAMAGIRLFLWGHGVGRLSHATYLDPSYSLSFETVSSPPPLTFTTDLEGREQQGGSGGLEKS